MTGESIRPPRSSGVLLHPTSLPGPGIGDLGAGADRFLHWLRAAGQRYWQILPLVPVDRGGSPYNGLSAMAGNPLLISPQRLAEEGLLEDEDLNGLTGDHPEVDYPTVLRERENLIAHAYDRFLAASDARLDAAFAAFREREERWLGDYALFRALRDEAAGAPWTQWAPPLRERDPDALAEVRDRLALQIARREFGQFIFQRQWDRVRTRAAELGIRIIGDLPIFVAHDSADVWVHRRIFDLGPDGEPLSVAGVPPDYFSETGQRWGNPLYRWDALREMDYRWWIDRFERAFALVDLVRVDHFRGFEAFWKVPAHEESAVNGQWEPGPGAPFFRAVEAKLGELPIIAEDLGLITPAVEALRDELGYPGMRVLQFAFDGDPRNPHLPENYRPDSVAYPGTHDNDTLAGWWRAATESERRNARRWTGIAEPGPWDFITSVFRSTARLTIVPVQDLLGLGSEARMNTPGEADGNWRWRVSPGSLDAALAEKLRELTIATDRGAGLTDPPAPV